MSNDHDEGWINGLIAKRTPDVLLILSQLIEAGLAKGECSANDIKHRDISEPNTIGCTFKTLRSLGFRQLDKRLPPAFNSQNGRKVHVWSLDEPQKARAFLRGVRHALTGQGLYQAQRELF